MAKAKNLNPVRYWLIMFPWRRFGSDFQVVLRSISSMKKFTYVKSVWIQELVMFRDRSDVWEHNCWISHIDDESSDSVERKEHFTDELSHVLNDNLHLDFPETTEENWASCTTVEQKYSSVEIPQSRKLTEKGLQYQIDMKVNSLKSKKTALNKTLRKTLLLRGKCSKVYETGNRN